MWRAVHVTWARLFALKMDSTTENHRAQCEARYWLKATGGKPANVHALWGRIKKKRGKAAANRLIQDMRQQWKQENHRGLP